MINLARMQKNYIMRSFVEYYKGDKIKDELHETCNTHGRHEQWAAYMQKCIVSMEEWSAGASAFSQLSFLKSNNTGSIRMT